MSTTVYSADIHYNDQDYGRIAFGRYLWLAHGVQTPPERAGETWIPVSGGEHWIVIGGIGLPPPITSGSIAPVRHTDITRGVITHGGATIYIVLLAGAVWWIDVVLWRETMAPAIKADSLESMIAAVQSTAALADPIVRTAHAIEQWLAGRQMDAAKVQARETWKNEERRRMQLRTMPVLPASAHMSRGTDAMNWTICESEAIRQRALDLCRGDYQRAIVMGTEALSGSTLRGFARRCVMRYKASSTDLITRMRAAGLRVSERVGPRGARLLVIGEPPSG